MRKVVARSVHMSPRYLRSKPAEGLEVGVQLEESICNLEHENMRVIVFMTDQNGFTRPPHTIAVVVFL